MTNENIVTVFKAFSDESRVQILHLLKDGELCGNSILEKMNIGQSTLSHHMKLLCESGVVVGRKNGKWMYYSISKEGKEEAKKILDTVLDAKVTEGVPVPSVKSAAKLSAKETAEKKVVEKKPAAKKPAEKKAPVKPQPKPVEEVKETIVEEKPEPKVQKRQLESWLL